MNKYFFIASKSLKSQFTYRSTTIFSLISSLLYFFIQLSLWTALIESGAKNDTTLNDMIVYIIINSAVLTLTSANIASMIETSVIDGSVAMHFLRPVKYKGFLLSSIIGTNLYRMFTNVLPIFVIGIFFIGIPLPPSPLYFLLFIVSVVIGVLIYFEITYIVGLLAFWIQRCWFLRWYLNAGVAFFGGTVVPLWFYPNALKKISVYLPFRYISFEPVNIFLGNIELDQVVFVLLIGLGWLVILNLLDRIMWNMASRKFTVNGG